MSCRHRGISCTSGAACLIKRAAQVSNLRIAAFSAADERAVEHGQALNPRDDLVTCVRVHLNDRVAREPSFNQRRVLV